MYAVPARTHRSLLSAERWRVGETMSPASRQQGIAQQTGDRHRADPARNRGQRAGYPAGRGEIYVAKQTRGSVRPNGPADPDIDHRGAGFYPTLTDQPRPTHRGD